MSGIDIMSESAGLAIANAVKSVAYAISKGQGGVCYGFTIDGDVADPTTRISYIKDAVGLEKAYMDFSGGVFHYGSWESAFFMPKPCMVGFGGDVRYYLNPNDYSKKEDGSASDIANTAYDGNAMMEFPKIYWKVIPSNSGKSATVYIADHKVDAGFHCWCNIDKDGREKEHFYMAIYQGSTVSSKMRSLSGIGYDGYTKNTSASTEISLATACGDGWYISQYSDILLVDLLLILMFKTTNIQNALGRGNADNSWNESYTQTTGIANTLGLFYGTSSGAYDVARLKIFGMENYYGNKWKRLAGLINDNGNIKYKLTRCTADGSTATDYNTTGSGYISSGIEPSGTSGGYISEMVFNSNGSMIPKVASGSDNSYYCDGMWFNNSQNNFALFGGRLDVGSRVGASCFDLDYVAGRAGGSVGASLSFK